MRLSYTAPPPRGLFKLRRAPRTKHVELLCSVASPGKVFGLTFDPWAGQVTATSEGGRWSRMVTESQPENGPTMTSTEATERWRDRIVASRDQLFGNIAIIHVPCNPWCRRPHERMAHPERAHATAGKVKLRLTRGPRDRGDGHARRAPESMGNVAHRPAST
ncbi:unnamed protein product [Lampetra fluviatilis]